MHRTTRTLLALALLLPAVGQAQHAGHAATPVPPETAAEAKPREHVTTDHSAMDHSTMDHSTMDHSAMDHSAMDHSTMDHSTMDHSTMDQSTMEDHRAMDHPAKPRAPREPIPILTDADRAAAFPVPDPHLRHASGTHSFWLLDRLEMTDAGGGGGLAWEGSVWVGGDIRRLWLRSEGEARDGGVESGSLKVLYGRAVTPWWDVVAGLRHDIGEGPSRNWAALGVQGMAPYKFEVAATAYLGPAGRTAARLEAEYETLLTNRLVLQWGAEANLHGRADPALGVGAGLSTVEAGARLRYEVTRRVAPYLGIERERAFGATAGLRTSAGEPRADTRLVAGVRLWF
ncbi:MAG TPA: copper resistance protein B [Thermomonas sp.]|nr:copper resistance protein B [Thermomonas sp.]